MKSYSNSEFKFRCFSYFMRPGNTADRKVHSMLGKLCQIQDILHQYSAEAFLPVPVDTDFNDSIIKYLREYSSLAAEADKAHKLLWNIPPKFHWMWHLGARSKFLNPRRGNTLLDEDWMGKAKLIVQSVAHGTESHMVPLKFHEKYGWAKFLLMHYE